MENLSFKESQINFLKQNYSSEMVDAAIAYANEDTNFTAAVNNFFLDNAREEALELGADNIVKRIDRYKESAAEHMFSKVSFAYIHGMFHGIANPNTPLRPKSNTEFVNTKDFAFFFNFGDNDFSGLMENAAKKYCNEYNSLLNQIDTYSKLENCQHMLDSYKDDLSYLENAENIKNLLKALFIGEYMGMSADRVWLGDKNKKIFDPMERLRHAEDLANNYFGFDKDQETYEEDGEEKIHVYWAFGHWDDINKIGLEQYKYMQTDEELERANGDFSKYWLNGETLIVRMVEGKLKVIKC